VKNGPEEGVPPAPTAGGRYEKLTADRSPFEDRARDASALTIPGLIPPTGSKGGVSLAHPWQSVGARGVNNLAAKLLLALFPPGSAFFRLAPDEAAVAKLSAEVGEDARTDIDAALSLVEKRVITRLEGSNLRPVMYEYFRHLLVGGNGLIVVLKDLTFKFFPLEKFVVKRDLEGNALEIIVKESLSYTTLPPAARDLVRTRPKNAEEERDLSVDVYTWVQRSEDRSWRTSQEIDGQVVPGSDGAYPKGKSAWLPGRWSYRSGEDYSRGMVEDYYGDLFSLESLSQSIVEGAAGMAKMVLLLDEAGVTDLRRLKEARNLDIIPGNANDISVVRMDKSLDFGVAKGQAEETKQRLEQAFLLTSSVQRNAERVTAEEIRVMAAELEQSLGGIYSLLSQDLQRPLIARVMAVMEKNKELPPIPDGAVHPQIITGLEGLGRTGDLGRLDAFLSGLAGLFGPDSLTQYIHFDEYASRRAAALSIDPSGLVKSQEEVAAEQQKLQQMQLAGALGPDAIKAQASRDIAATKQDEAVSPTP
jgi:hypothetical protein